jgi:nitrogen fixation protein FixH
MSTMGARIWPWVPGALLSSMLAGLGTLAAIAMNDPGFALERDYYRKAVGYDREIEQRTENAQLGWRLQAALSRDTTGSTTTLVVSADDAAGPVTGAQVTAEAIENAHAATVFDLTLVEIAPGRYRATVPVARPGLWELRLSLVRGGERFTEVVRLTTPGGDR